MIGLIRSWRHTRFVQRYRPFAEDQRRWRRVFKAATPDLPDGALHDQRVRALADRVATGWPDESR